jgi:FtsP/CotA-like multicopper oxidase with cupredoxin domain
MKKLFYFLILAVLNTISMNAQSIANYAFSTATTPNALVNMDAGTSTQLISGASTNVASSLTGIGFPFYFMGAPYTQFSVNSNGQMSLGATVISGTGITAAGTTPLIVPISGTNTLLSSGKVHYAVRGIAPNRILVVEWKDLMIPAPGGNDPPVPSPNQLQVILHETTGVIDFKYGMVNNNAATTTARSTFIASSNTATTVKSIGTNLTSATDAATVSTYLMTAINVGLLNLRTYTFTPPVAVASPTWAGTPFTTVTPTGMTLNWMNVATTHTSIDIYNSVDGGLTYNWVATLPKTATNYVAAATGTASLWLVAAVNEGAAAYSTPNTPVAIPGITVVNCGGTSTLTATGTTGTLLWSTGATTASISVTAGGVYTVTQTIAGLTSVPGSATAIPQPTITGPVDPVTLMPATLGLGATSGQVYRTEPGMTAYEWIVSANGQIVSALGLDSIKVNWTNVSGQQTVSVRYKNTNCLTFTPTSVQIINYFPFAQAIDPFTVPQFVDPMPHFAAGLRVDAKNVSNLIVKEVMVQQVALSTGTITATGKIGDPLTPNAGKGNYAAYAISKDNGTTFGPAMWPAQTIETRQGNPLTVQYKNELVGVKYSDFNILADQTLLMNGYSLNGDSLKDPYNGDIPMVVHLHGGEIPSGSDGGPTAWFMPTGSTAKKTTGPGFAFGASSLMTYPNQQEATTLWYHPHDQGLTRINVYTGLAGYYFLRGAAEETAQLPGWSGDDKVQEVTPAGKVATFNGTNSYLPEIELAVQDRMFNTKGELYWPVAPTNPELHPFWTPEFFGNIMTVNGKTWPYLSVAARKYRFRLLDGCNARFLNMWLQNLATNTAGPKITIVGTDGGLLDAPVVIDPALANTLTMAPGERYDVIIDFTGVAKGTVFTLMNNANAPYPGGDPVIEGLTDRIMQFVVNGNLMTAAGATGGQDKSLVPANLRSLNPMVKLTNFAGGLTTGVTPLVKRQIILNEVTGAGGPVMVAFNNSHFDTGTPIPGEPLQFGGPTEIPLEGSTELITIINTTVDAHPIHIHLAQWQLVSRQTFNQPAYMAAYNAAWLKRGIPEWPAGQGYPGGAGSPYRYDSINVDGAVGGNPAVGSFLTGTLVPANPEEMGWKDDIKVYPGEIATFVVRFSPTDAPLTPTPAQTLYPFDPSIGPGYVWHCHIIDHEDMDMMRPLMVKPSALRFPQITNQPQSGEACNGGSQVFSVTATSATTVSYQWQISSDAGTSWTNLTNVAPYSGALTNSLTVSPLTLALSTKMYRVVTTNIDGVTTSNGALLTVVPLNAPASVTIAASANNVIAGTSVTFTPTPVNGGNAPSYQWFKNSVAVATTPTYTYIPVNNDAVYVVMTSSLGCVTASPATSNSVTMSVQIIATAAANGDWNTPATWSTNAIPTSQDNVVIPTGKTITINVANANCKDLNVVGALTSTAGANILTINGNLTLAGTLTTGANTVVMKGTTSGAGTIIATAGTIVYGGALAQTVSNIATNVLNNLTIDNKVGVTLPSALTVSNTLTITAGSKLTNPTGASLTVKNVVINSDAILGTGTFVDNGTTTTTVGGLANVQQYLTGGRNWYVSSPVTTATSGSISTASLVQSYNEPLASWIPESGALSVLRGYVASVSTDGNVTFSGSALNTGVPANTTLTRTGVALKSGYNLVGNPYPSYLDWSMVSAGSTNLESTIWYRTRNAANTIYVFDTYNANGNIGTGNNGTLITSQIPPMQAFWTRVATGFTTGTIALNNTMRSHEGATSNRLKAPALNLQKVLRLQVSNGINSDETVVLFNDNALDGLDAFDSEKMSNGSAFIPEINTFAGTVPLVINGLKSVYANEELPLGFATGEVNTFTIKATELNNFDVDTKVVLKDKLLNTEKELVIGNDYSFNSDATSTSARFSIVFKSTAVATGLKDNVNSNESIYIFRNLNNQITVNCNNLLSGKGTVTVTVCNAIGQKLVDMVTTGTSTVVKAKLIPGVYLVTVNVAGINTIKKIVIN